MPTKHDLHIAERIRDTILGAAGEAVERILFYGSRVTGRLRPSSDYDILVVLRDPVPDWVSASLQMSDLFSTFEHPVDVQVFGLTEFEESRPVAGAVAYTADRSGVPLYVKRLEPVTPLRGLSIKANPGWTHRESNTETSALLQKVV
ncbi:MAG TPA: nucleotidyltransferase domain-containing protein [Longimicrobium sp.]|nr:nucleotidyltransferase domain-containing protein [Longimicrobium sp.]